MTRPVQHFNVIDVVAKRQRLIRSDPIFVLKMFQGIQKELENGIWSIPVSQDIYHKKPDLDTLIRWLTCGLYSRDKVLDFSKTPVILEGRAAESELDGRECPHNYNLEMDVYDDFLEVEMIYINCKGDILTDCDTSYANQEKHSIGNILHGINLADFLLTYSKEEQKEAV